MKKIIYTLAILTSTLQIFAQNGPGGIGSTNGNSRLKLWLMGDSGITTTTGSVVIQWNDKSGYNHNLYSSSNIAPSYLTNIINQHAGLHFNGTQYITMPSVSNDLQNNKASVFIVEKDYADSTKAEFGISPGFSIQQEFTVINNRIYHSSSSGNFVYQDHDCAKSFVGTNAIFERTLLYGTNDSALYHAVNGKVSTRPYVKAGVPSPYTITPRQVCVGGRNDQNPNEFFNGTILEVIVYDTTLSANEIKSIESYLNNKYSIQNNLCGNIGAGIDAANDVEKMKISPNPTNNTSIINLNNTVTNASIKLINLTGKTVFEKQNQSGNQFTIDLSAQAKGVYFVEINQQGNVYRGKVVKE